MKLRLTGGGFSDYTGQMGVVYFEKGLSKFDVMPNDAIRIASVIGAEWENGDPANLGDIHTRNLMTPAPDITQQTGLELLRATVGHAVLNADQAQQNVNSVASMTTGIEAEVQDEPVQPMMMRTTAELDEGQEEQPTSEKYTRESLEAIADKEGIAGLRVIGNQFGVKANSISALIDEILKAQG